MASLKKRQKEVPSPLTWHLTGTRSLQEENELPVPPHRCHGNVGKRGTPEERFPFLGFPWIISSFSHAKRAARTHGRTRPGTPGGRRASRSPASFWFAPPIVMRFSPPPPAMFFREPCAPTLATDGLSNHSTSHLPKLFHGSPYVHTAQAETRNTLAITP